MPDVRILFTPIPGTFYQRTDGTVHFDLTRQEAARITQGVVGEPGDVVGGISENRVSVRLLEAAHRFVTNKYTTAVGWYHGAADLPALKWALEQETNDA